MKYPLEYGEIVPATFLGKSLDTPHLMGGGYEGPFNFRSLEDFFIRLSHRCKDLEIVTPLELGLPGLILGLSPTSNDLFRLANAKKTRKKYYLHEGQYLLASCFLDSSQSPRTQIQIHARHTHQEMEGVKFDVLKKIQRSPDTRKARLLFEKVESTLNSAELRIFSGALTPTILRERDPDSPVRHFHY